MILEEVRITIRRNKLLVIVSELLICGVCWMQIYVESLHVSVRFLAIG